MEEKQKEIEFHKKRYPLREIFCLKSGQNTYTHYIELSTQETHGN